MPLNPLNGHDLIRSSFVHLRGIGDRTERQLWAEGVKSWEDLRLAAPTRFGAKKLSLLLEDIDHSLEAWERGDLHHFHRTLPSAERWRMIPGAFPDIAYFDIEANGGGMPPLTESTVIAFLFRGELYQEHEKAKKRELIHFIQDEASMFCTFNGAAYDVPFLAHEFEMSLDKAHIDLCHWLRNQGFKGGLKAIQKAFPHLHQRSSHDIDGWDAVKLWRLYELGHDAALPTLMCYNAEDVLILHPLLVEAFNRQIEKEEDLGLQPLAVQALPELTTTVDLEIYEKLRSGKSWRE